MYALLTNLLTFKGNNMKERTQRKSKNNFRKNSQKYYPRKKKR